MKVKNKSPFPKSNKLKKLKPKVPIPVPVKKMMNKQSNNIKKNVKHVIIKEKKIKKHD